MYTENKFVKWELRKKKHFAEFILCHLSPSQWVHRAFSSTTLKYIHVQQEECNEKCTFGLPSGVHSRLWALFWATSALARVRKSIRVADITIFDIVLLDPITLSLPFNSAGSSSLVDDANPLNSQRPSNHPPIKLMKSITLLQTLAFSSFAFSSPGLCPSCFSHCNCKCC